ncbi:flagellar basal body P-ring protein FlgI [Rubinisphaera margarita]|uniref:flagellar basal body P-ring protein FlgI n=1 Tax=Rubinisphaera margarita TaxID=2909586 RepID=UPI001EE94BAB|nr:flagellar basal body P-ring protein FlgI [Rubinisphaera margarita]MCG6156864.1 flagellar basal body P-ring protein FlgI [Rubinisphaera margarita]
MFALLRYFRLLTLVLVVICMSREAGAQIRLESICTVHGHKEVRLTGMGLVVGLNGTGDGGNAGPTIRALAAAMKNMNVPITDARELRDAKNVAIVMIEATIPKTGLHQGQRLDCYVSSYLGSESLRGGRLLIAPIQLADMRSELLVGTASGATVIEDPVTPTRARIPGGVVLETDLFRSAEYLHRIVDTSTGEPKIRLLLNESHSSFISARMITEVINEAFEFESFDQQHAKAVSPSVIDISIPKTWQETPVDFIAEVLDLKITSPHSMSRVQVNAQTGVVILSGDVELSPVLINHPNLQISIGNVPNLVDGAQFRVLSDEQSVRTNSRLDELVQALNQLGVPREAMIEVLRELARSGKLHAIYEEI